MKRLFAFVLLMAVTQNAFGQENWREVDLRVSGVGSGTSYAAVIRKFGKPLHRKKVLQIDGCGGDATYLTLVYSGLKFELLGDAKGRNLSVYALEITSSNLTATSGIKLGNTTREVQGKFGKPNNVITESGQTVLAYVTKGNLGGVSFHFAQGKLVKMSMQQTLC